MWIPTIALSISTVASTQSDSEARPNIVVVMTDDQGYGDLGATGNELIDTPHIDALARASASMRRFYVSPVCTPTRACLMTGRYNYRTRAIDTWVGRAMMEPEEVTIAEVLSEAGYRTGIFGKWHLGDCYPCRPMDQGFDEALVHRGGGIAQPSEPPENRRRYTDATLFRNGRQVQSKGYCTDVYFDAALEFIEDCDDARQPFFVYLPTNAPHGPFHDVPEALYAKYRARDLSPILGGRAGDADRVARIFAMIENIDVNVGRLLRALDSSRLADNTIVVYLHDNGPQTTRYVGEMRGTKSQVYDGGIRSPLFVRWPGRLRAGTIGDAIGAHIDLMPTLLDAAGVSAPAGVELDGRSLLPLLEGGQAEWTARTIFLQTHRGDTPARYHHFAAIEDRWKLLRASGFGRERPPEGMPFELYDLRADPLERRNLATEHPAVVARIKAAYDRWFDDVSSTRPDNYAPPRIVVGTDAETETTLTRQDWRRAAGRGHGAGGAWLLRFAGEHDYRVRVLIQNEVDDPKVELWIGDAKHTATAEGTVRSIVLPSVRVGPGDAQLEARIDTGGDPIPPYHVILTRR